PEDADAAFAYAEHRVSATTSRLAVANQASQTADAFFIAMQSGEVDRAADCISDRIIHDDRRRLSGDPVVGHDASRRALERILAQYNEFELHTLAVRGERLLMFQTRWTNDAGYETAYLHVQEVD